MGRATVPDTGGKSMEIPKAKEIQKVAKPAPEPLKPKVKFHIHLCCLTIALIATAIVVGYHIGNDVVQTVIPIFPNFLTEILDRIRKV
jgi:hypothetical protein